MTERTRDTTSAIVDGIIRFVAAGGFITSALIAPNVIQALDKPAQKFLNQLDQRQRERELRRITRYMRNRGLIQYDPKDYEHGIKLTSKGKRRLTKTTYEHLRIPRQKNWDHKWRLVFFDIPEVEKSKRNALTYKLKQLGYKQLQFSIWVHPFPSRTEIEAVCETLHIRKYVTYVEISKIDANKALKIKFKNLFL